MRVLYNNMNTGTRTLGFLVNMSLQCYLPELGHGAGPTLGAGRARAAATATAAVYSYLQLQLSYRYTATFTGKYKVQLQLYSYSCSSALHDAPRVVLYLWNSNNA